jgi:RNA polymerase sigma-70 factor (sigma-E family)
MGVDHTGTLGTVARGNTDELSIEALFRAHGARLVRVARMFVDDRAAAEDIVQEAFIRFHRKRRRLREPAAAAGYLRATVLNLARDHNRRGVMSRRHIDAQAHHVGDVGPDPDDAFALDEEHRAVIDALSHLPPRQRDCLVMRYHLEMSPHEIGDALGIGVNSVKTHLTRALRALRERMEAT